MMIARVGGGLAGLLISCWNAAAPAADCAVEAAMLAREQSELPRLEVASPQLDVLKAVEPLPCGLQHRR